MDASKIVTERRSEALKDALDDTFKQLPNGAGGQANASRLKQLFIANQEIAKSIVIEDVLENALHQLCILLPKASHAAFIMKQDDGRFTPLVGRMLKDGAVVDRNNTAPLVFSESLYQKAVDERKSLLLADVPADFGQTASIMHANILSALVVPLWHGDEVNGVLQVDNRNTSRAFTEDDLQWMSLFGQMVGQALAHADIVQRLKWATDQQERENRYLKRREQLRRMEDMLGESPAMKRVLESIQKVADTRVTVLIQGETGTGKERVASAIHYASQRADKMFVAQNCAALTESLLESELFGHKKGAFTGATEDKKGLFEVADQGTLFLDEVTEMPLALQAKLLRVLQEGELRAVGSSQTKKVDVRVVAATNRNLKQEVKEGHFREDLFYRLSVFPIEMPPLRDRREDISLLAKHFLKKYTRELGKPVPGLTDAALNCLQVYDWPGNVRELENEIQRVILQVQPNQFIEPEHLSAPVRGLAEAKERFHVGEGTLRESVEQFERWVVLEALRRHNNNKSATAKALGITREGFHKKLKNLGL